MFVSHSGDIVGRLVGRAPGLGYPLLFFRSTQGKIFFGAALLVALVYFLIGLYEDRRLAVQGTAIGLQTVLAETQEFKVMLAAARHESTSSLPIAPVAEAPQRPSVEIEHDVRQIRERTEETTETIRQLVGAIGEYGTHLRSHTAVMQNLAATTAELHRATVELSATVAEPTVQSAPTATAVLPSGRLAPPPARPLNIPFELVQQRAALAAHATRIDELLDRVSARPRGIPATSSPS